MARKGSSDTAPSAKQVVFLLMAGTVVAVVVFVGGVLVGQGARGGSAADTEPHFNEVSVELPPAGMGSPGVRSSQRSAGALESSRLTYSDRLMGPEPSSDIFRTRVELSELQIQPDLELFTNETDESVVSSGDQTEVSPRALPDSSQTAEFLEPDSRLTVPQGFAVQVGALRSKQPAQEIAKQLRAKNYPATVVLPDSDAPIPWFRVRVGPYPDKAEAERVRQRLATEEQFNAFVTR